MNAKKCGNFLLIFLTLFLFSCQKEDHVLDDFGTLMEAGDDHITLCTELYPDDYSRAFGNKQLFWDKKVIKVRFLEGSEYVQNKVRQYAQIWSQYAGITFQFVKSEPSDIRISFNQSLGSWSYVGKTNNYIASNKATMNFGWFNNNTSETEFRRTTLHEFGHVLGLSHEHQHPLAEINWNREAVYTYYEKTQDWSRSDVDVNIFQKYSKAASNYSDYDPLSIMHYYIPRSLVLGSWTPKSNTRLSTIDQRFIQSVYPLTSIDPDAPTTLECNCPDSLILVACDDFESYDAATFLSSPQWDTWSPTSASAEFQSYNWGKVIKLKYNDQANPDVLFSPGLYTEGQYRLTWDMYVRSNHSGYFNIQKGEIAGEEFGSQFYFKEDQSGVIYINGQELTFNYVQEQWNQIGMILDFDGDQIVFELNNQEIARWPLSWSARTEFGRKRFHAINFYAAETDAQFWLDDFCMSQDGTRLGSQGSVSFRRSVDLLKVK